VFKEWTTMPTDRVLLMTAVAANGLLTGAALDQAVKQLPARHRIGVEAFSAYSQAADLSNGVAWYATLGVGTAALSIAAVVAGLRARPSRMVRRALWVAAAGTVGHMAVTAVAAPLNFSQRHAHGVRELTEVFDTFERLNTLRAALQVVVLGAVVVAALVHLQAAVNTEHAVR
jgi:hypothetical protein